MWSSDFPREISLPQPYNHLDTVIISQLKIFVYYFLASNLDNKKQKKRKKIKILFLIVLIVALAFGVVLAASYISKTFLVLR